MNELKTGEVICKRRKELGLTQTQLAQKLNLSGSIQVGKRHSWYSGELFGYYHDWLFHMCREEIFDCNSGGIPHQHCMDTLIAQKQGGEME